METLFAMNWAEMFVPTHSVLVFLFLRFFLKRQTGVIGIADLLIVVLIADAAQNGMAAEYKSITEGAILVGTIAFWNFAVDWKGYNFPRLRCLTRPSPLCLIRDGQMLRRNMRKEFITDEELLAQLRKQGVERPEEVKHAFIEGDGRVSVVRNED